MLHANVLDLDVSLAATRGTIIQERLIFNDRLFFKWRTSVFSGFPIGKLRSKENLYSTIKTV